MLRFQHPREQRIKDERAAILKNAGPSKDLGNKIKIYSCPSLETESKSLLKTMTAGILTFCPQTAVIVSLL